MALFERWFLWDSNKTRMENNRRGCPWHSTIINFQNTDCSITFQSKILFFPQITIRFAVTYKKIMFGTVISNYQYFFSLRKNVWKEIPMHILWCKYESFCRRDATLIKSSKNIIWSLRVCAAFNFQLAKSVTNSSNFVTKYELLIFVEIANF